jgi:hypothetical protein
LAQASPSGWLVFLPVLPSALSAMLVFVVLLNSLVFSLAWYVT